MGLFDKWKKSSPCETNTVYSPVEGSVITLEEVDDGVFSKGIVGDGCGIIPSNNEVVAPFDGVVSHVIESKHAIGLENKDGLEVLIHVGIDTVSLNGKGFTTFVKEGDKVKIGQKLLKFDKAVIASAGYMDTVIIVITNSDKYQSLKVDECKEVAVGNKIIVVE